MRGFDTKALVLFPYQSFYEERNLTYKFTFSKALSNLCAYLKTVGIVPHAFITDDVARSINCKDLKFVSTLSQPDLFFASKNIDGMENVMHMDLIHYDDVEKMVAAKLPIESGLSVEQRFDQILARDKKAANAIIPQYKIVVSFYRRNSFGYKVVVKRGVQNIRIQVDAINFIPVVYMAGIEENACDLLNVPYANRSLSVWEVNSENT